MLSSNCRRVLVRSSPRFSSSIAQRGFASTTSKLPPNKQPFPDDDPAPAVLDNSVHIKNFALATALVGFAVGVMVYSMNRVGQAGDTSDDPLAALKEEASHAAQKQAQEQSGMEETADMLRKFQAGGYDPDLQEQEALEEAQEAAEKRKKAWWKFW
mgnify:CR=1 FL=1